MSLTDYIYNTKDRIKLHNADCLSILKGMKDNSVDCMVTDPPYGYSFMGKNWDKVVIPTSTWKECLRVLKPGAFAFVMSAPRQDVLSRMIYNLQEAGFETGFSSIYWSYACLSEDTKILTEEGLKGINEITNKDIVYSLDTKANLLIKSKIKNVFIYPFEGKMFNLKNQNTDQLITLNHKILCKNKHHSGIKTWWEQKWKYVKAFNLNKHYALKIPISAKYEGTKQIGKNLASLLGWILSEGHFYNSNRANDIRIYQSSVNLENVNEIRSLLNKLKIPHSEYHRLRNYKGRDYTEFCFYFSGRWVRKIKKILPNKQPTKKLLELVYGERLALYNALIKGDGSRRKVKENYKVYTDCFYQNNTEFLDWFEILVLSLGWQTKRNRNKQCVSIKKQSDTEFQWINYHPKSVDYKGKIWCIETETGNFVAWRKERYFITGNSGFPKTSNIAKKVDKRLGIKREVVGNTGTMNNHRGDGSHMMLLASGKKARKRELNYITKATSPQAKELDGSYSGFQPKPAVEIIIVAMKPLSEKTYVDQALKNGKGITWLDNCRIPYESENDIIPQIRDNKREVNAGQMYRGNSLLESKTKAIIGGSKEGRFPANLLVSNDVLNDGKISKGQQGAVTGKEPSNYKDFNTHGDYKGQRKAMIPRNDSGSYSRYFDLDKWWIERIKKLPESVQKVFPYLIVPKASKREKNKGCENLEEKVVDCLQGNKDGTLNKRTNGQPSKHKNNHPTVKPIKLMSYLITLGSIEGEIVLDPFMGSGTTGIASKLLNHKFIGIEMNKDYFEIAQARIKGC